MNFAYLVRRLSIFLCVVLLTGTALEAQAQQEPRPTRRGRKYKVRIDSAPQQAAIYLEDEKYGIVGYTPWSGRLQKGNWKVIIKKDGYEPTTRNIVVKRSGRTQETFLPMVKKEQPAILEVRADADRNAFNSEVWVDGQLQGTIPVTLKLKEGRHLVEIKKSEFEVFTQWVSVKEGERLSVVPVLKPLKVVLLGSILVSADVAGAEVMLDGNKQKGTTPMMISDITAGPHVIEVTKSPALPWRQTIQVEGKKTTKVIAQLKATVNGQGGNIRVLSNVEAASVFLDGEAKGAVPLDLKNVKPGEHVVEIRSAGFVSREERVTVAAGSALILKLDLQADGAVAVVGTVRVVSPIPEAAVYIDGESVGPVPQEKQLATGDHFIVVSKPGFKSFEKKLVVEEGKVITVTAELKSVGGLRFLSNPGGAQVMMDGQAIGATPMVDEEVASGEHIITISLDGYLDFETSVKVEGGKMKVVNAVLEKIETGPTDQEVAREQRSLSSFGALALPAGRSTIDASMGYPYFFSGGITVGAGKLGGMPFDAGVDLRTYFARTDLALKARLTIVESNPFSFGAYGTAGFGGELFGDTERKTAFADLGLQGSLTGLGAVTITGKSYLNLWSDRHCPEVVNGAFDSESDPVESCIKYLDGSIDPAAKTRIDKALGEGEIFNRDNGARFMVAFVVEIALKQRWNVWMQFETGIFEKDRAAFMDDLYAPMLQDDPKGYIRTGATYKF